jgi:hypothetical protein
MQEAFGEDVSEQHAPTRPAHKIIPSTRKKCVFLFSSLVRGGFFAGGGDDFKRAVASPETPFQKSLFKLSFLPFLLLARYITSPYEVRRARGSPARSPESKNAF